MYVYHALVLAQHTMVMQWNTSIEYLYYGSGGQNFREKFLCRQCVTLC